MATKRPTRNVGRSSKKRPALKRVTKKDWKKLANRRSGAAPTPLLRHAASNVDRQGFQGTAGARAAFSAVGSHLAAIASMRQMTGADTGAAAALVGGPGTTAPVAGANNWTLMGPMAIPNGQTYTSARVLVTGRVTAIAVDPTDRNTIYIGTAQGGVWKSSDGGASWSPRTDNEMSLAIGALVLDPATPSIVYAGTGEGNFSGDSYYGLGLLKSVDGGSTWTSHGTATFAGRRFSRLAVTPTATARVFAATTGGLYRSTDSGVTWTKMTSGLPANAAATDVVVDPLNTNVAYASFWQAGLYKTTNAAAPMPTWTQLTSGLPIATAAAPNGFLRVSLAIAPTDGRRLFALFCNNETASATTSYTIDKLRTSADGGATWATIPLPGGNIGRQGFYNLFATVDSTTPDIVYFGGVSLWKAARSGATWTVTDVGGAVHPDNHAVWIDPADHLRLLSGNDGGIYRSTDGGATWDDSINKGIVITQFEFIDNHPVSDAFVIGGTQDNGTESYRAGPVFYHADEGDGGFTVINASNPTNVLATYYGPSPKLSVEGGKFGTWSGVWTGITGSGALFYPPLTACRTNPNLVAIGTSEINLDATQGTGGWPTKVPLPGSTGFISAISYVSPTLIYAATQTGQVYRLTGPVWAATLISQAPLPGNYIWDVSPLPTDDRTLIVVMSGFGIPHVWRGVVPAAGAVVWTNISGAGAGTTLPDIPVNALVIDPTDGNRMFIATDIAVFRTQNGGATWQPYSAGLPNCAVFDLKLHEPTRRLRAATHGRGLWEKNIDAVSSPAIDLYVRDHVMHTGHSPSPFGVAAAIEDPLRFVALSDPQYWWMSADIKVDALEGATPAYQMPVSAVDYVNFEAKLQHRHPQRARVNRVYVQVHNRGHQPAAGVQVKLLWASAAAGLPNLPADFWTAFPADAADTTAWHPIGAPRTIASVVPCIPAVLEWDWTPPVTAPEHSCLLLIVDSASDPIPATSKVFAIDQLVPNEKRATLKNLHLVVAPPSAGGLAMLHVAGTAGKLHQITIRPHRRPLGTLTLLLPKGLTPSAAGRLNLAPVALTPAILKQLTVRYGAPVEKAGFSAAFAVQDPKALSRIRVKSGKTALPIGLLAIGEGTLTVTQAAGDRLLGGSTLVVRKPE